MSPPSPKTMLSPSFAGWTVRSVWLLVLLWAIIEAMRFGFMEKRSPLSEDGLNSIKPGDLLEASNHSYGIFIAQVLITFLKIGSFYFMSLLSFSSAI